MKKLVAAVILAFAGAGGAMADDDDDCHAAMERWQPREAVQTMAEGRGWGLTRIKVDDGCYELRGTDETGRAFKAKIDPATLEVVEFRHRDDDDEHHGTGAPKAQGSGAQAGSNPPASMPFGINARPKAVVK